MAGSFKGGIHPYEGKELTQDKPTRILQAKGELIYPMNQHIGEPAKPIVAKGDKVVVGQIIGEAVGSVSANVISSVSGTVKVVEPRLTVSGTKVISIVVENDNEYRTVDGMGQARDYKKLSKVQIRQIVKEAGIVGMGGAGYPTHLKLTPKDDNAIDYVIVNGSECEPYLTSDYRMMLEQPKKLVEGLRIVLSLFGNAKGIIAIEDNKPKAIELLNNLLAKEEKMEVRVVKTKYPEGSERQLLYATVGRAINFSKYPTDVGCIIQNVDTILSVYNAVAESTPLIRRVLTVSGDAVKDPANFIVPTGMLYSELVEEAGGFVSSPKKVVSGGTMMGQAIHSLEVPVTKTSSALLGFLEDDVEQMPQNNCIHCGRCVRVCPCRLTPQKMMQPAVRGDKEGFIKLHGMECYECGSCTYVCPSGIFLTQSFKEIRRSIMNDWKREKEKNK